MELDRLPPVLEQDLAARARSSGRSFTELARLAVLDGIEALEGRYRAAAADRGPHPAGGQSARGVSPGKPLTP